MTLCRQAGLVRCPPNGARPQRGRTTSCRTPMCPFCSEHAHRGVSQNVNKRKKNPSLTSHAMSHSAQFHTSTIPWCPKSSWYIIRNIPVRYERKAISVLWPVCTPLRKHMTRHYSPGSGFPGILSLT